MKKRFAKKPVKRGRPEYWRGNSGRFFRETRSARPSNTVSAIKSGVAAGASMRLTFLQGFNIMDPIQDDGGEILC